MIPTKKPFLCKLGLHQWNKPRYVDLGASSNVKDYSKYCLRCKKKKRWVVAKQR